LGWEPGVCCSPAVRGIPAVGGVPGVSVIPGFGWTTLNIVTVQLIGPRYVSSVTVGVVAFLLIAPTVIHPTKTTERRILLDRIFFILQTPELSRALISSSAESSFGGNFKATIYLIAGGVS
jgi:hypothetical protein